MALRSEFLILPQGINELATCMRPAGSPLPPAFSAELFVCLIAITLERAAVAAKEFPSGLFRP